MGKYNLSEEIQRKVNYCLRFIEPSNRHVNCIRVSKCNSETAKLHRAKIIEIALWMLDNDEPFMTEAKFLDKSGKADILALRVGAVYEVLNTETKERFLRKNYPLPTYPIKISDEFRGL